MKGALPRLSHRLAVAVLGAVVCAGVLSILAGYDPVADVSPGRANQGPTIQHLLGTDPIGRDVAWRLAAAVQAFLGPGLVACGFTATLGVTMGAAAGWYGGWPSATLRFLFDLIDAIPRFVLALLVCSIYGNDLWWLATAAGLAYAPTVGEAIYMRITSLRAEEYVLANQAYGLSDARILWVHLVWGVCRRLVARHLVLLFGYFLVLETTLSYLGGFGVQEPTPSWGNMLTYAWGRGTWLAVASPALALWITVMALYTVARELADEH